MAIEILAATGPLVLTPLPQVMRCIAKAGFTSVEVMSGFSRATHDAGRIKAAAQAYGLQVGAIHGPFLLAQRHLNGSYANKCVRGMQLAKQVGAKVMVAHSPFRFEPWSMRWLARNVPRLEAETGVAFAMENLYPAHGLHAAAVITIDQMRPFTHLTMDTSHAAVSGIDLFEMFDALHDKIVHLHVADNYGKGVDSHAPLGQGILPLARFLTHVGNSGWSGSITLELDVRAYLDTPRSLSEFLARQRLKCEAALAGEVTDKDWS